MSKTINMSTYNLTKEEKEKRTIQALIKSGYSKKEALDLIKKGVEYEKTAPKTWIAKTQHGFVYISNIIYL